MNPNTQKATAIALGYLVACLFRFQSAGDGVSGTLLLTLVGVTAVTLALLLMIQALKKSVDWSWWNTFLGFTLCLIATGGATIVVASMFR